jgi:hypothetical protein
MPVANRHTVGVLAYNRSGAFLADQARCATANHQGYGACCSYKGDEPPAVHHVGHGGETVPRNRVRRCRGPSPKRSPPLPCGAARKSGSCPPPSGLARIGALEPHLWRAGDRRVRFRTLRTQAAGAGRLSRGTAMLGSIPGSPRLIRHRLILLLCGWPLSTRLGR